MQNLLSKNRWIIMLAAIATQACTSFPSLWGVFQQSAATSYGITLSESATIFPMCVAFFGVFSIVGGRMQDKVSPRLTAIIGSISLSLGVMALSKFAMGTKIGTIYLLFSLPFGGGCGLAFPAMINPLLKWFADKKGFAMGASGALAAAIMVVMTYLSKFLLSTWGMQKTVLVYGISFLAITLFCSMFFVNPSPEYIQEKTALGNAKASHKKAPVTQSVDFTPVEMLKTKQYYLLFFASLFAAPAYMLIAPSVVTTGIARGLTENQAVSAVALATGASAIGKFVIPALSDKIGRKPAAVIFLSLTLVSSILLMKATGTGFLIIYAAMVFVHGGWATLITPFGNDMFGFKNAGTNNGFITLYNTVASFASSALVTILVPILGGNTNHYIAIIGCGIAVLLIAILDPNTAKIKQKLEKKLETV